MLPRNWDALAPLVDRLLDAPADQRAALAAELAEGDPVRQAELERLVAECEQSMALLDGGAAERFSDLAADEPVAPLPEILNGRYQLERELGRGGMAVVYLARDLKHARHVAVKVIRSELAASLGRDRFLREIGIAARLRHPNIMPLYDSGDADGVLYYVMPYEDGQSLRARLERDGRLCTSDAISILRDVARALAYAHEQGVVHRDVKPDNVLLSGDAAVVTDFGIAKAFSAALTDSGAVTVTQSGSVIGTPAYMAPEQGMGDPATDHRADLYSFGCLAYEVFAGKPPFTGSTTFQIIAAQMAMVPKLVTASREDVPAPIAGMIARCLEKNPADRPHSASQLLDVLSSVSTTQGGTDRPIRHSKRARTAILAAAALLALLFVGWYELSRGPVEGPVTLAVLPLSSRGGDSTEALVAEGFGDDLATALFKVPWIRVKSRGGAANYRGQANIDPAAIGRQLGVHYLVTGSWDDLEQRRSVTVQLLNSENLEVVWADKFERPPQLLALRDRIVQIISDSLRPRSGGFDREAATVSLPARPVNNDAYVLYLAGKRKLSNRGRSVGESIANFRQAIALDSLSAAAWSGLSLALVLAPNFEGVPFASVAGEAKASAERAIRLDPRLAEPHIARGLVLGYDFQWDAAEAELKKATDIDPRDVEAMVQYGRLLLLRGKTADALRQFKAALVEDPASAVVLTWLSAAWLQQKQLDSALVWSDRAALSNPAFIGNSYTRALLMLVLGRRAEARGLTDRGDPFFPSTLYVVAATGDTAAIGERLRQLNSGQVRTWMPETSRALALLGKRDTEGGLRGLERASETGEPWPWATNPHDPEFDPVRASPRFRAIVARSGLAEP